MEWRQGGCCVGIQLKSVLEAALDLLLVGQIIAVSRTSQGGAASVVLHEERETGLRAQQVGLADNADCPAGVCMCARVFNGSVASSNAGMMVQPIHS